MYCKARVEQMCECIRKPSMCSSAKEAHTSSSVLAVPLTYISPCRLEVEEHRAAVSHLAPGFHHSCPHVCIEQRLGSGSLSKGGAGREALLTAHCTALCAMLLHACP